MVGCGLGILALLTAASAGDEPASADRGYTLTRDVVYAEPDGERLLLDAYVSKAQGRKPAVLVVHGGSWKSGDKFQLSGYAMRLASRGYAAFAINYRLAPKHPHPAQIDDCRAALEWIVANADEYDVDPERIGAIGYSAGAHLVFLLGVAGDQRSPMDPRSASPRLRAVAAGGSPVNFTAVEGDNRTLIQFLGGTRREVPDQYVNASPYFYLTSDDPPIFFFHGDDDELVTIRGPEVAVEILRSKGVEAELLRVPKANHITAAMNLDAVAKAMAFLDKHLKPRAE
jgi:acetyl esterase/lipase